MKNDLIQIAENIVSGYQLSRADKILSDIKQIDIPKKLETRKASVNAKAKDIDCTLDVMMFVSVAMLVGILFYMFVV